MNYRVVLEVPIVLRNLGRKDAISVAISEVGKKLKGFKHVEIDVGMSKCPICGDVFESSFVVGDVALVGLYLGVKVFNAESENHAKNIAKSMIGKVLKNVPIKVFGIERL